MVAEGIGLSDLPAVYREEYLRAVEVARARHDPASDWDGFVEALWAVLVPAFGLDVTVVDEGEHRHRLGLSEPATSGEGRSAGEVE